MAAFTIDPIPGAAWPAGRFGVLQATGAIGAISHGVTTRDGPDFGDDADTDQCAAAASAAATALGLADVAWVQQVHGGAVLRVGAGGLAGPADALVTDTPGLAILGRSADCPLVLAAGQRRDGSWAVGFAHASWRATVAGLTAAMLARLCGELAVDPGTIRAVIAPCARVCCYEVGDEVREIALAALGAGAGAFFRRPRPEARWHFDLEAANLSQLAAAGVAAARTATSGICTICRGERFWSWRRQGAAAGRFAALIGVRTGAL